MEKELSEYISAVANHKMEYGLGVANGQYADFIELALSAKPMLKAMQISVEQEEVDAHVVLKIDTPLGAMRAEKVIFLGEGYPQAAAVFSDSVVQNGVLKQRDLGAVLLHSFEQGWVLPDGLSFSERGQGYSRAAVVSAINFAMARILRFNTERALNAGNSPLP